MNKCLLIGSLIILITISGVSTWNCAADTKAITPKQIELPNKKLRSLQASTFTPIEIYYDYTKLDKQKGVTDDTKANLKKLLTEAKDLFKAIIKTKRIYEFLSLGNNNCGENVDIEMSSVVRGKGVEADVIIFPFVDFADKGDVLAYASSCLVAGTYYRPVAGYIGFPINALKFERTNWFNYYLSLVMHEMTHILVFSSGLFDHFVDKNDQTITKPATKSAVVNGVLRTLVITPKVVEVARLHFGCSTLEGVELENQGGSGTAGSHWEARLMLSDYMIGMDYDETVLSDITLALFEDSGWYKVSYYTGGLFRFGRNGGCPFLNSKCIEDSQSKFKNEFCDKQTPICTNARTSKGTCGLGNYKSIPENYQYFPDQPTLGGFSLADYCPVSRVVTDDAKYLNWNCKFGDPEWEKLGEIISDTSLCFVSSLTPTDMDRSPEKAICYSYKCDFTKKQTIVTILGTEIECPTEGGTKNHDSFEGSLQCPKFSEVCTTEVPCGDIKSCINNKSASILSKDYSIDESGGNNQLGIILLMLGILFIIL